MAFFSGYTYSKCAVLVPVVEGKKNNKTSGRNLIHESRVINSYAKFKILNEEYEAFLKLCK